MENAIVVIVLAIVIGAAVAYIVREKKKGVACIGCSAGGLCPHRNNSGSGCGCSGHSEDEMHKCCDCHITEK